MTSLAQEGAEPRARGRLLLWALILSLIVNVFFLAAMVWVRANVPVMPTPRQRMEAIAEELQLTPDQHDAFQQFLIEMRRNTRQLRDGNLPLLQRAWAEMAKPSPDQGLIGQVIDQTSENRRAYQKKMAVAMARFLGDLKPEQRSQFVELLQHHRDPAAQHLHHLIMP
ncbi:MAG TPA: periplasmic heavy metal sensor [Stellaceae bacterium]|nr:periplasmic heavy metal sensor [Stellaceae bacterium]